MMAFDICCPKCGSTDMLSVEPVMQCFRVSFTEDGDLDFDGDVVKEWPSEDEDSHIQCNKCYETFSRSQITNQFEELKKEVVVE